MDNASLGNETDFDVISLPIWQFSSREFVVMLFHYDGAVDEWKEFEWSETAIHISVVNQTKW